MSDLLTPELELIIPPLYSTEEVALKDKVAIVKYLSPYSNWVWYAVEGSREDDDFIFFGLVYGFEKEWGYFSLSELMGARKGDLQLVERDTNFEPTPIKVIFEQYD